MSHGAINPVVRAFIGTRRQFSPVSKAFCTQIARPICVSRGITKKRTYEMPGF